MSDHPPDPESSGRAPLSDGHTEEYPAVTQTLATPPDGPAWLAGDDGGESGEEWVSQTTHGIRLGVPAAALLAIVLVAGGFWGGAALEKSHGGSSSALASVAARFRSAAGGVGATGTAGTAASRFGGLFGGTAGTAGTAGTISVVNGNTLYVDDTSTGSIVKVTLTKSTTITRNADAAAIDLRPGDTVTVQGATGSSGAVTATSVTATAPGVSSGFAGLGRGFGGAGAAGTGSTGTTSSNTTTTPALFGGG
jgi:hypothetical protein